jgi:hypothetical protein
MHLCIICPSLLYLNAQAINFFRYRHHYLWRYIPHHARPIANATAQHLLLVSAPACVRGCPKSYGALDVRISNHTHLQTTVAILIPPDIWHKQTRHSRRASFKVETDVIKSERSDTPGPTKAQARKDKWGRARSGKCC